MRYSHKPYDSTFTMLEQSITDLNQWTNEARVFPSCCLYKMSSVTPPLTNGCIKTDSNRVELQFRSTFNMNLRYTLIDDATDENVENSVASFTNKKLTTLFVRLPLAGLYSVVLFGEPVHLSDCSKEMSQDMLLSFKVHTTCDNGSQPFPDFTHLLGSLPAFTDAGFRSSVNFPIIETEDGYARFTVNRPGGEPIRFKFRYANGTELDEYIFGDTYPEKVVFNIRCPKKGEYSLILFARFNDDLVDKTKFKPGATYLILNKNERGTPILPYPSKVQWGPTDNLSNFNISLQPQKGAEITCNKEEATFELGLSSNEQINISYKFNTKEDKAITSRWVCAENNWREKDVILRFRFRAPVSGFYEFNIFAGKVGAKSNDCIGSWLINVVNPYEGDLFIGSTNVPWGPNVTKMKANDLQVLSPTSSTIYSSEEESTLIIASKIKRRTGIIFNLKNDSGNDMYEYVLADSVKQNDETVLYKIRFHPPESGFYSFDLFCVSGGHLGSWMIDVRKSKKLELPSNDKRPWGPVQNFYDYGFLVVEPESAILTTTLSTESKLTIATDQGKILGKLHFQDQEDNLKDCFDIEYFTNDEKLKKIVITFKLPQKGYYKFSLYVSSSGQGMFDYGGGWLLHCV
ncbi:uncharacterized protein LOC117100259 [Anneissia japonica]|uniref:uncharacterized protein LOC117100259 n=1 Tax=Anneissia japonica TaxID=1529436 RepID=UPI001425834C|nr:uncharacterized protein LOC117100259 [Anneissia japonica]